MKNLKHCDERIQTDGITAVVTAGLFLRVKSNEFRWQTLLTMCLIWNFGTIG